VKKNAHCDICAMLLPPWPEDQVVLSTEYWRVALAPDQIYLGRVYVTYLEHVPSLSSLSNEAGAEYWRVVRRYENAVRAAFGADLFNWGCLMNDTFKTDHPVPHVHYHVRPRYAQAPVVYGNSYADPNFGHHYQREQKLVVGNDVLRTIRDVIRAGMGE
jgi:diadenosine tetraphosphate (Ap4A) HIT family hydrolase